MSKKRTPDFLTTNLLKVLPQITENTNVEEVCKRRVANISPKCTITEGRKKMDYKINADKQLDIIYEA